MWMVVLHKLVSNLSACCITFLKRIMCSARVKCEKVSRKLGGKSNFYFIYQKTPQKMISFLLDTGITDLETGKYYFKSTETREHSFMLESNSAVEKHYCVTRKELLVIVRSIVHFNHYLYGRKFIIQNDAPAAQWLLRVQSPEGQLAHWFHKIKQYDFIFQNLHGKSN